MALNIDLFAGGGGASVGLQWAGCEPDIAVNHDRRAIIMHEANHPNCHHYWCDVFEVDPREATGGQPVNILWASPDCTFHSKARGAKPHRSPKFAERRRALANVVITWARAVRPRVIMLENVEEFAKWGPLDGAGKPIKSKAGYSFRKWVSELSNVGYTVDWRILKACDYGSPTSRKRLFIVASRDGCPEWPEPTHGPGLIPHRTAAEIIDWSIPVPSIFERTRPLADATNRRIARGVVEKCLMTPDPYVAATLVARSWGERPGQAPRVPGLEKPLGTIAAGGGKHAVVLAYLARHWGGMVGKDLREPWPTVTTKGCQDQIVAMTARPFARGGEVRAFLQKYYTSGGQWNRVDEPAPTIRTKAALGLVTVEGRDYQVEDIGMRMLSPPELFAAQGFPSDYEIAPRVDLSVGAAQVKPKTMGVTDQIWLCGNSVCPQVAEALAIANS